MKFHTDEQHFSIHRTKTKFHSVLHRKDFFFWLIQDRNSSNENTSIVHDSLWAKKKKELLYRKHTKTACFMVLISDYFLDFSVFKVDKK